MKKILLVIANLCCLLLVPAHSQNTGISSWYGAECAGKLMANGKPFNPQAFTCASWFFPLGTRLQVINLANNRMIAVEVTDRGPAKRLVACGRIVDLSYAAFAEIGQTKLGLISVSITKL